MAYWKQLRNNKEYNIQFFLYFRPVIYTSIGVAKLSHSHTLPLKRCRFERRIGSLRMSGAVKPFACSPAGMMSGVARAPRDYAIDGNTSDERPECIKRDRVKRRTSGKDGDFSSMSDHIAFIFHLLVTLITRYQLKIPFEAKTLTASL